MSDDLDSTDTERYWPLSGDRLFVSAEDADTNALLWWHGDDLWAAYADGYKKAADILVERVQETASDQDFLVYPIGFLYRHYVELRLKSLIMVGNRLHGKDSQFPQNHDLWKLWHESRAVLEKTWPRGPKIDLDNVEACIREFVSIDPISEAFRYPATKNGKHTLPNLSGLNLRNLMEVVGRLASLLDSAFDAMLEMLRIRREAEDYFA